MRTLADETLVFLSMQVHALHVASTVKYIPVHIDKLLLVYNRLLLVILSIV